MNLVGDKSRSMLGLAPSEALSLEQVNHFYFYFVARTVGIFRAYLPSIALMNN